MPISWGRRPGNRPGRAAAAQMSTTMPVGMLDRGDGVRLAVRHLAGRGPTILFLPGYMSDMGGTKARFLWDRARARGQGCVLFDYSGCGASEGALADGSIGRWAADALAVARHVGEGPLILVGSSMGGWVMLHVALLLGARVSGLVGVAAAPDFTRWGLAMTAADRALLAHRGSVERPSGYSDAPYRYHAALMDDAERACVLDGPIGLRAPARLLHGMGDADVPWQISVRLAERLQGDVQVVLVKDGDHRLSGAADLVLLDSVVGALSCG